ncbi:NAD(P)H dehydrogenase OS=Streptomyces glaucescens OX=1907 GN=SGLAU_32060 PE=3 SV=1 [Streptomyces glaucescens]
MVVGHPRSDSLTAQLAQRARDRLAAHGFSVDVLDLHAEGFDPRTGLADEPDWEDPEKECTPEVRALVFPLWWLVAGVLKGSPGFCTCCPGMCPSTSCRGG